MGRGEAALQHGVCVAPLRLRMHARAASAVDDRGVHACRLRQAVTSAFAAIAACGNVCKHGAGFARKQDALTDVQLQGIKAPVQLVTAVSTATTSIADLNCRSREGQKGEGKVVVRGEGLGLLVWGPGQALQGPRPGPVHRGPL